MRYVLEARLWLSETFEGPVEALGLAIVAVVLLWGLLLTMAVWRNQ
jgi:hypothetical protein